MGTRFLHLGALFLAFAPAACGGASSDSESLGGETSALTIGGLFATGVDAMNAPLARGTVDPHYGMTSTDPALPGPNAIVVNAAAGWTGNTAASKWIAPQLNANGANRIYTYTTTFNLAGVDPSTASITGSWACDDTCVMSLNGTAVAQNVAPNAWTTIVPFTVPVGSPFKLGSNQLSIAVTNSGGGATGLQIVQVSGNVGQCTLDSQCSAAQFCDTAATTCVAKIVNGAPVPTIAGHTPPLTNACSPAVGTAVCVAGVCDVVDNDCGYANGDGPCTGASGATLCRSTFCATTGAKTGTCVECVASGSCPGSKPVCDLATNVCVGCATDADCGGPISGFVCDDIQKVCESGCRGTGGNGCPSGTVCSSKDATIGMCGSGSASSSSSSGSVVSTSSSGGSVSSSSGGVGGQGAGGQGGALSSTSGGIGGQGGASQASSSSSQGVGGQGGAVSSASGGVGGQGGASQGNSSGSQGSSSSSGSQGNSSQGAGGQGGTGSGGSGGQGGMGKGGAGGAATTASATAGSGGGASVGEGGSVAKSALPNNDNGLVALGSGCACRMDGDPESAPLPFLAGAALTALWIARRRRGPSPQLQRWVG